MLLYIMEAIPGESPPRDNFRIDPGQSLGRETQGLGREQPRAFRDQRKRL